MNDGFVEEPTSRMGHSQLVISGEQAGELELPGLIRDAEERVIEDVDPTLHGGVVDTSEAQGMLQPSGLGKGLFVGFSLGEIDIHSVIVVEGEDVVKGLVIVSEPDEISLLNRHRFREEHVILLINDVGMWL